LSSQEIATWIQAVGSAGSLLAFAAWVGIAIINRKDEHELRFERQAQTVAAWLDKGPDHGAEEEFVACIVNGGDSPVYNCRMRFMGLEARHEPAEVVLNLVPPHTTKTQSMPSAVRDLSWEDVYDSGIAPELVFRDSSGRRWVRDEHGMLREG
jgi:hypothetical protein